MNLLPLQAKIVKQEHPYEGKFIRDFFTKHGDMYRSLTSGTAVDDNDFSNMAHVVFKDPNGNIIGTIFYEEIALGVLSVNIAFAPEHANRVTTTAAGHIFIKMMQRDAKRTLVCLINKENRASRLYAAHMGFTKVKEVPSEEVRPDCHVGTVQLWRLDI